MLLLNNGVRMPAVGLGTFRSQGEQVALAVKTALSVGIRHIDTASIYKVTTLRRSCTPPPPPPPPPQRQR